MKKQSQPNDLIRFAMSRAARLYGPETDGKHDGVFTCATFSAALQRITGIMTPLDGLWVKAILCGRSDVESLAGGSHYRLS